MKAVSGLTAAIVSERNAPVTDAFLSKTVVSLTITFCSIFKLFNIVAKLYSNNHFSRLPLFLASESLQDFGILDVP